MALSLPQEDRSAFVGEDFPRWVVAGLLSLGVAGILLALWLLSPLYPYRGMESAPKAWLRVEGDGRSAAPVSDVSPTGGVVTVAADKKSAGKSEPAVGMERSPAKADTSTAPATLREPAPPQPEPARAVAAAKVADVARSARLQPCPPLFTINFAYNSATPVMAKGRKEIGYLRDWLGRHPQADVLLDGYTDALGSEEYNLVLSYRRARAVAAILADAGLPSDRLLVRAFGEEQTLSDSVSTSGEKRRVTVRTEGSEECARLD